MRLCGVVALSKLSVLLSIQSCAYSLKPRVSVIHNACIPRYRVIPYTYSTSCLYHTRREASSLSGTSIEERYVFQGDSRSIRAYKDAGYGTMWTTADAVVTDPPYCLLERRRKGGDLRDPKPRSKLDNQPTVPRFASVVEYKEFTASWMNHVKQVLKPDGVVIVWTNALGKAAIISTANSFGLDMLGEYVWAKRTVDAKPNSTKNEVLLRIYETGLIFQDSSLARAHKGRQLTSSDSCAPWSVVTGYHDDYSSGPHLHPCHKPHDALEPLIRHWTKPGQLIVDPFAGSGGILASAVRIGDRRVVGIEKLDEWVEFANKAIKSISHSE